MSLTSNKEELDYLSDLWGTPPDLSMIWDTTDTPKQGRAKLAKVYSILKSTGESCLAKNRDLVRKVISPVSSSPSKRSPVATSLASISKARDLLDPMKKDFAMGTPLSTDEKADPMKTLQFTTVKERPHINSGLVPYSWETKKC